MREGFFAASAFVQAAGEAPGSDLEGGPGKKKKERWDLAWRKGPRRCGLRGRQTDKRRENVLGATAGQLLRIPVCAIE